MRVLLGAVVVMSVLIVAGVATLAVTIVHRLAVVPVQANLVLDEPPGTQVRSIAAAGDQLAVLLTGGGSDRIVLLDARTGRVNRHVGLAP